MSNILSSDVLHLFVVSQSLINLPHETIKQLLIILKGNLKNEK